MRKKMMEVLAKLKNIVVLDCNKEGFYKKVQYLMESSHVYIIIGRQFRSFLVQNIFYCLNNQLYSFSGSVYCRQRSL